MGIQQSSGRLDHAYGKSRRRLSDGDHDQYLDGGRNVLQISVKYDGPCRAFHCISKVQSSMCLPNVFLGPGYPIRHWKSVARVSHFGPRARQRAIDVIRRCFRIESNGCPRSVLLDASVYSWQRRLGYTRVRPEWYEVARLERAYARTFASVSTVTSTSSCWYFLQLLPFPRCYPRYEIRSKIMD